ncbi:putative protein kinase AGC-RSK-2 family [Helianthus annuus]|nr:putative protein kinase AGC-RSK-2 family [Helianthus annuus]KAJ0563968.1 putative protein kinase AGC-RSK-2 family [Helianthus annuus]
MEPPCTDDLADDLQSISFNSTTTTATDINRSTSSSSETTWTTATHTSIPEPITNLSYSDIRFINRLGAGDIGSVYLSEIKRSSPSTSPVVFAAKVMDKRELASRNKQGREKTEKEILQMLDHPFLPTLYASVESPKWSCLLTEFCPGGDLHVLRQRQPGKRFPESTVRFYASEVVVALEYLHMLDIIYRDLKPENVLVRSDGHIMLTDFDLSLKSNITAATPAQIFTDDNPPLRPNHYPFDPPKLEFPKEPVVPAAAKDLISQLLVKDPVRRLGSMMGASAIKQHSFFDGVNWALLRCMTPPFVPPPFNIRDVVSDDGCFDDTPVEYY